MKRKKNNFVTGTTISGLNNESKLLYVPIKSESLITGDFEPQSFSFSIGNEVIMKITQDGFFWKGNLVQDDKEIYNDFKEFLKLSKQ